MEHGASDHESTLHIDEGKSSQHSHFLSVKKIMDQNLTWIPKYHVSYRKNGMMNKIFSENEQKCEKQSKQHTLINPPSRDNALEQSCNHKLLTSLKKQGICQEEQQGYQVYRKMCCHCIRKY